MRKIAITGQLHAIASDIKSVERMIEQDAYSIDVIRKIQHIRAAVKNVTSQVFENHISDSVMIGIESPDLIEREKMLQEITDLLITATMCGQVKTKQSKEIHMTTVTYFIPSINCGGCKRRLENWLATIEGVQSAVVDVPTRQAVIAFDEPATEESIKNFLASVNYPVQAVPGNGASEDDSCCG